MKKMKNKKILTYCIDCKKNTIHIYKGDIEDMNTNFICRKCETIAIPEIVSKDVYNKDVSEMFMNLQKAMNRIGFSELDILSLSTGTKKKQLLKIRKKFHKKIRKKYKIKDF